MIYSYITPNSITESTKKSEEIVSVVYNEYCNYKQMLENCTDESARPILEAKVEVLYEISFKDIIQKIKDKIHEIIEWVKGLIKKIKEKLASIFDRKKNVMNAWKSKKVSTGESALFEADENYSDDEMLMSCLTEYRWVYGNSKYTTEKLGDLFASSTNKMEIEAEKAFGSLNIQQRSVEDLRKGFDILRKYKDEFIENANHLMENTTYEKEDKNINVGTVLNKNFLLKCGDWFYREIQILDKEIQSFESGMEEMTDIDKTQKMLESEIENDDSLNDDMKKYLLTSAVPMIISIFQAVKSNIFKFENKIVSAQNTCVSRLSYITKYAKRKKWIGF